MIWGEPPLFLETPIHGVRFSFKGDQKLRDLLKLAPSHYRSMAGQLVCIGYPETSLGVSKNFTVFPLKIINSNRVFP